MTRRALLVTLPLAGCGGSRAPRENLLPETVGIWRRTGLKDLPQSAAVQPIAASTVRRIQSAAYDGPGKLNVTLYELTSSAAALDAVQRWRPAANTIFFYRDELFVVVEYETADRQALNAFVKDLNQHLAPRK